MRRLGFGALLVAADPFVGTWKLNPAKSKYKAGTPPKEVTVTTAEAGSDFDVTVKATLAEGDPISSHYTVAAAGGEGKIIESPYEAVSSKRMGPSRRDLSFSKGGKILYTTGRLCPSEP